jgi:hypothetical protein
VHAVHVRPRRPTLKALSELADLPLVVGMSSSGVILAIWRVGELLPRVEAAADGAIRNWRRQSADAQTQRKIMANDEEWVEDVKRWYLASTRSGEALVADVDGSDDVALGYEAADPALQARHWPDAPTTGR